MIQTIQHLATASAWQTRLVRIAMFTLVIAILAQIRIYIPGNPIPVTMQTLGILLAGMALGPAEGVASVVGYLGLVALGLDGRSVVAFAGSSAGYLIGFVPGALIAGLGWRAPQRWRFVLNLVFGALAVTVVMGLGMARLAAFTPSWGAAFMLGVVPFIFVDLGKVLLAASLINAGQAAWARWITPSLKS